MKFTLTTIKRIAQQATTSLLHRLGLASYRDLKRARSRQAQTVRWLVENSLSPESSATNHGTLRPVDESATLPLVSIVMPTWNRSGVIARAIESIRSQDYLNWELLIVDDGSTDRTASVVEQFRDDPRIRLFWEPHRGVSAARNRALREARGEFVAYLDSDNSWFPHFLSRAVSAFEWNLGVESIYAAQVVEDVHNGESYVRAIPFDRKRFLQNGGIDLNIFVHRKRLFDELGGFDEGLTRLVDWELIGRYACRTAPLLLPIIGGRYVERRPDSISARESWQRNRALLRQRQQQLRAVVSPRPLRVLWAVWNYPQLTETYIRCELTAMQRWGVEVNVWSEIIDTKSPYASDIPVHHGSLAETIARVRPDVVHVHWLNKGKDYRDVVVQAGLPMTVRGHSYEFATKSVKKLLRDEAVRSIYLFPHFAKQVAPNPKLHSMTSAFNEAWFSPTKNDPANHKDRHFVLRTGAGKPTKGLESYFEIASRCPQHRFVLVLGLLPNHDDYVEQLLTMNRQLGSPVEIRLNVSNEETAELMREAGIYLHTYGDEEPFGLPVSIAEAMATGAYTLARDLPGATDYLGSVGALYRSNDEAVLLIQKTLTWSDEAWQAQQALTSEYAHERFASNKVLRPLLDDWLIMTNGGCFAPGLERNRLRAA